MASQGEPLEDDGVKELTPLAFFNDQELPNVRDWRAVPLPVEDVKIDEVTAAEILDSAVTTDNFKSPKGQAGSTPPD
jgi:hypothetical protein